MTDTTSKPIIVTTLAEALTVIGIKNGQIERLTRELETRSNSLRSIGESFVPLVLERDRLRASLVSAEAAMFGVGAWLLHRFGRDKPETAEGDLLIARAQEARKALDGERAEE